MYVHKACRPVASLGSVLDVTLSAGLPDGAYIFIPKIQFRCILESLAMKTVGIFNGHLEKFMIFRYRQFVVNWYVYICLLWCVILRKTGNPCSASMGR
jgi:hypothetical protein